MAKTAEAEAGSGGVYRPCGWASALAPTESLLFGSGAVDYAGAGVVHISGGAGATLLHFHSSPQPQPLLVNVTTRYTPQNVLTLS